MAPYPARTGINQGWIDNKPTVDDVFSPAQPSGPHMGVVVVTVADAAMAETLIALLRFPAAVVCKNTEAWMVLHRPVLHQTARHSELA
mmetsp:Transcript_31624/g.46670  ORF Transcript_31624/g.46670 Transcript_31624/m.46670 type:complete len:88 (+) Transcript_31624:716-979(+)